MLNSNQGFYATSALSILRSFGDVVQGALETILPFDAGEIESGLEQNRDSRAFPF